MGGKANFWCMTWKNKNSWNFDRKESLRSTQHATWCKHVVLSFWKKNFLYELFIRHDHPPYCLCYKRYYMYFFFRYMYVTCSLDKIIILILFTMVFVLCHPHTKVSKCTWFLFYFCPDKVVLISHQDSWAPHPLRVIYLDPIEIGSACDFSHQVGKNKPPKDGDAMTCE